MSQHIYADTTRDLHEPWTPDPGMVDHLWTDDMAPR
jgi:hypothetical protein